MALRVRVTDDYQVEVPGEARAQLNIDQGDTLLLEVRGNTIILIPEPSNYAQRLRGLHREIWEGVDTDTYLREERDAWGS